MTGEKDLVLIYFEDNPLVFARIEDVSADIKKDWYQVKLLMLQLPLQTVTWILRDIYIDGQEFTMNGKKVRLEKVDVPEQEGWEYDDNAEETNKTKQPKQEQPPEKPLTQNDGSAKNASSGRVISLADHKSS